MERTAVKLPDNQLLDPNVCLERSLSLTVRPELAIIGRIALVFSRRGLTVREFNYCESNSPSELGQLGQMGRVEIRFRGNDVQLDSVTRELTKIQNVVKIRT